MNIYHKEKLAKFMALTGINYLIWLFHKTLYGHHYIRVINYHCTPELSMSQFEKQLKFFQQKFVSVDQNILFHFLSKGKWKYKKPGLIISFDDGLRCNYDFAVPLLEKYGFTGWFMIPVGFINIEPKKQLSYMKKNGIHCNNNHNRLALNFKELKDLQKRSHVICCHSMNHKRLIKTLPYQIQFEEVSASKTMLEKFLSSDVRSFAWVGGEENSYSTSSAKLIRESAYLFSFTTNAGFIKCNNNPLSIGRINIESNNSLNLVKFQLSGFIDLWYFRKRQRVNRKIL